MWQEPTQCCGEDACLWCVNSFSFISLDCRCAVFFLSNAHVNSVLVYMITATLENDSPLHFESICCWELGGQIGSFIHY